MSDSPEKLILEFWEANLEEQLATASVFNTGPDDDDQPLPYATLEVDVDTGPRTNTGGYRNGTLVLALFHRDWKPGLDIVTTFYKTIQPLGGAMVTMDGDGISLDNFRLESGGDTKEADGTRHFLHTYTFRIHETGE